MISVCLITARKRAGFQAMADSLDNNVRETGANVEWVVVDEQIWHDEKARREELADVVRGRFRVQHVAPKPNIWRGPHRLTSKDHWAKASASNTAFIYARGQTLVMHDDNCVFDAGWLRIHMAAAKLGLAAAGAYKYLAPGAVVKDGVIVSGDVTSNDHRLVDLPTPGPCPGNWLYGGCLSLPLDVALNTNGYDEIMDGSGGLEDSEFGVRVGRAVKTWFFPDCVVYHLTENHDAIGDHVGGAVAEATGATPAEVAKKCKGYWFRDAAGLDHWFTWNHVPCWRLTAHQPVPGHAPGFLKPAYAARLSGERERIWTVGNGRYSLRELRAMVSLGAPLPIPSGPTYDWRDLQPLRDM